MSALGTHLLTSFLLFIGLSIVSLCGLSHECEIVLNNHDGEY